MTDKNVNFIMPGDKVESKQRDSFTYQDETGNYSSVFGLARDRIIPLKSPYYPRSGDTVIGVVSHVRFSGYSIDIAGQHNGSLSSRNVLGILNFGDVVMATIDNVDGAGNIDLGRVEKIGAGRILDVSAAKIPRIIGKNNSMISLIEKASGCEILVGRNGRIWINLEGDSNLAINAIQKIEQEAHISGLTARMSEYLGVKVEEVK